MTFVTFLSLPNDIIAPIITGWLKWKAVGRLDRAICNRAQREDWLQLLKNHCIFLSVSVAYLIKWHPTNLTWCILRQIRTLEFNYGNDESNANEMIGLSDWLRNTSQHLTTLQVMNNPPLNPIVRPYQHLRAIFFHDGDLNDPFWDLLRLNPHISELYIRGADWKEIPDNLELPSLTKFSVLGASLLKSMVVLFIYDLHALRSLRLGGFHFTEIYQSLPTACPKLVHLDLRYAEHFPADNDSFYTLMRSLHSGLRGLVLPTIRAFTSRELQSIADYHADSLRCLCIPDVPGTKISSAMTESYGSLINNLPYLHTLDTRSINISKLSRNKITNPSITHLLTELIGSGPDIISCLGNQCPNITKLSLLGLGERKIVKYMNQFLKSRPLIRAICVPDCELVEKLKGAIPHVSVKEYKLLDIFQEEN